VSRILVIGGLASWATALLSAAFRNGNAELVVVVQDTERVFGPTGEEIAASLAQENFRLTMASPPVEEEYEKVDLLVERPPSHEVCGFYATLSETDLLRQIWPPAAMARGPPPR